MRVAFPSDEYSAQVSQPKVAPTMDISEQGHNILYIGSHFDPRYVSSPAASRRSDNQGSQHSSKDGLDRRSQPNTSNGHTTRSTPTASELVKDLDTMLRFGSEPGHDAKVNDFLNALNHAAIEVHKYS